MKHMKFIMLINAKMPTIVCIFTFISWTNIANVLDVQNNHVFETFFCSMRQHIFWLRKKKINFSSALLYI